MCPICASATVALLGKAVTSTGGSLAVLAVKKYLARRGKKADTPLLQAKGGQHELPRGVAD
ncbi:exported hypothetical protein [Paraburkholderia ribeironis]|uniref:Uncharacterized protein n=1 Tax=Paraburkholderia ribeironis TaxID=1247936 RepID=A0A1N7RM45_9BURK|nr:exported hypothetical protein [Paraburkholderia ribeironis]